MTKRTKPRARNAAATRQSILDSARAAFVRSGYDGAGVREIAAGAGVTAMMVNRYFGSKEKLFVEVMHETTKTPFILSHQNLVSKNLAGAYAAALTQVTTPGQTPLDGFLIMYRSTSSPVAAALGRDHVENGYQKLLTLTLGGKDAAERSAIALSLVAGFQAMRQMLELPTLVNARPETLRRLLEAMLHVVFDAPAETRKPAPKRALKAKERK